MGETAVIAVSIPLILILLYIVIQRAFGWLDRQNTEESREYAEDRTDAEKNMPAGSTGPASHSIRTEKKGIIGKTLKD